MCVFSGNMGLCGSIPSGLKVLQKTGGSDTAPAMYLNNKPCPVSADTQIQSSGASVGPSQVIFCHIQPCHVSCMQQCCHIAPSTSPAKPLQTCGSPIQVQLGEVSVHAANSSHHDLLCANVCSHMSFRMVPAEYGASTGCSTCRQGTC